MSFASLSVAPRNFLRRPQKCNQKPEALFSLVNCSYAIVDDEHLLVMENCCHDVTFNSFPTHIKKYSWLHINCH